MKRSPLFRFIFKTTGISRQFPNWIFGFWKKWRTRVALLLVVSISAAFQSCSKQSEFAPGAHQIVLLQVNFTTHQFEGGKIFKLSSDPFTSDTIPVTISSDPPADFGRITLIYIPSGDTLFDASTVWQGKGEISIPDKFENNFPYTTTTTSLPDQSSIKCIIQPETLPWDDTYEDAWQAIDQLKITSDLIGNKCMLLTFLYAGSSSINGKSDWHWFFLFYK